MNQFRTGLLLAAMTALFLAVGYMLGGEQGMAVAFVFALGTNLFSWWFSDSIVLSMHRAREVGPSEAPELYGMVERIAQRAQIPMPRVYIMPSQQPNAFATGRNPSKGVVAITQGLMDMLEPREIEAVMAHEVGHITHRDTLTMTITATIAGAIGMLANMAMWFGGSRNRENGGMGPVAGILVAILAPMAAMLVQMAISRSREYEADRKGAELCGDPRALASALQKLEGGARRIDNYAAENNPATAHLFIVNPLHMRSVGSLFSTHPSTEDRVRALLAMPGGGGENVSEAVSPWGSEPKAKAGPWG